MWENAKNILCIRLDSMGDVLMTTPALRALKESVPGRKITLLTSESGAQAAWLVPEIDGVIVYNAPWMKLPAPPNDSRSDYMMAARLQQLGFDAAVIFTVFSQSPLPAAFLCHLAGIPLRLAYCRENPYHLLNDWRQEIEPDCGIRHEVQRQLDLVRSIGCQVDRENLSLNIPPGAERIVTGMMKKLGIIPDKPWVVIHPGATAESRCYPADQYAAAARMLAEDHNLQILFTGSLKEVPLVRQIQMEMVVPSYSLAGSLSLGEFAALIDIAPVLITNNTGPAHIASAVGTPVVVLYALTNPQHTPWMVRSRVLSYDVPCKYCYKSICPQGHHDCLVKVTPGEVVDAAIELLEVPKAFETAVEEIEVVPCWGKETW